MSEVAAGQIFSEIKKDYLFYLSRALNKIMVAPDMIQIMLTSKCNLRCRICDVWKQQFRNELSTAEVKNLINQAVGIGIQTVYFTGGEAFLRGDIFELIDYAYSLGATTSVNTNGSLISEETARQIVQSKLSNVTFSIDSAKSEVHNFIRGEKVFEMAMEAMRNINKYKNIFKRYRGGDGNLPLDIGMVSVIMKNNIKELASLVILADKMGCCYVAFQPLVYNGNLLENKNFKSEFWPDTEDIAELETGFHTLTRMKREMRDKMAINFMAEKTAQHFRKERKVNKCFAGFNRIFVNPQGDISFVCFPALGNIREASLQDIWASQQAYSLREKIKECTVNCTQFCSERTTSEDINAIHEHLKKSCPGSIDEERIFLSEIYNMLQDHPGNSEEINKAKNAVQGIIDERHCGYEKCR
ncbi:MAG: radical SAM protein [Candidatus Omnitrophica bacterium]|nr:radical SAM protein [Candidatus Omnitrophota bacterium]MBU1925735.1 radical SAM protein [Candidatus Omnitrophota bacterium]